MRNIYYHFYKIADLYRGLRTTDMEPILYIKKKLKNLPEVIAADVGCGAGRYDFKLFQNLGKKLFLYCVDCNREMLKQLAFYLESHAVKKFRTIKAFANKLPFPENSFDCMFTFNAIHHFKILGFFDEASRTLKKDGRFIHLYKAKKSK